MNLPIQLGLDIATALSIIGAAFSVIRANAKARDESTKNTRKEKLLNSLSTLEDIARDLHFHSLETTQRLANGGDFSLEDDFLSYCRRIIAECHILQSTSFAVWAGEEEKKIIHNLREDCAKWNNTILEDVGKQQKLRVGLPQLMEYVENAYKSLGNCLINK